MATAVSIHQGAKFQMGKGDSRSLVNSGIGAQRISMNYSVFQPGQEFPQHFHDISALAGQETREMRLRYYLLEPAASLSVSATQQAESIWFVREGRVQLTGPDANFTLGEREVAFIPAGEAITLVNTAANQAQLIHCQTLPE